MQLLSVEDVEKILDETQEAVEYQQVSQSVLSLIVPLFFSLTVGKPSCHYTCLHFTISLLNVSLKN